MGTTLYKGVINPSGNPPAYLVANQSTTTLMTNVRNGTSLPVFQYYDANYSGTSTCRSPSRSRPRPSTW